MPDSLPASTRACLHALTAVVATCVLLFAAAAFAADGQGRQWDRASAIALAAYIDTLGTHGLDPQDYAPAELRAAAGSTDAAALDVRASESFGLVARDLAMGHLKGSARGRYFIPSDALGATQVADLIERALTTHDIAGTLEALAPHDRQYLALRAALAKLRPDQRRERQTIAANLERWRWLPHRLGGRYLLVNIPEYQARLFDGARLTASHRVIVGKVGTPTPQFRTEITGVILNPPWNVPQSIIAESVGSLVRRQPSVARARGYTWSWDSGHLRVTQKPGPQNALGQVKLDMPNPFTVYLHDTPTKDLFEREVRALSHGCIRTQNPLDLATVLLAGTEWTRARIDQTVTTRVTTRAALPAPVTVYVVYLTAVADDGGAIRFLDDPYKLDAAIEARLS